MSKNYNLNSELWKYIFSVFPIIDLPFGILCVLLSQNWVFTLCSLPIFPLVATLVLNLSEKYQFKNPGAYVFLLNGGYYLFFQYMSGPEAPGWAMLINVTIGASFMFEKPRLGQILVGLFSLITGYYFYLLGASWDYSLLISLSLLAFTILFSRTFAYMQLQQSRIESKNIEIETKNRDITDSINYSKKIQFAVLPHEETIQRSIPLFFILYKPKDIVSGDFYWFYEINKDEYIILCADCTGHGVPGAFMTVICSTILNQVVVENKIHEPAEILKEVDAVLAFTLKQESKKEEKIRDGMDLCLLKVNKMKKEAIITGAKRPAFFVHNGEITDVKNSKFSIGGLVEEGKTFHENKFTFEEEDMFFLYTDGFTDQFGGADDKKFMTRRLKEIVTANSRKSLPEQTKIYDSEIESWKGANEQTDDILIIGVRF